MQVLTLNCLPINSLKNGDFPNIALCIDSLEINTKSEK